MYSITRKRKKRLKRKGLIIVVFILLSSVNFSFGQGFVTGLGGTYGSDIESFGFNAREYMFIGHEICFGPEVSYFPKQQIGEYERSLLELNLTGHYIFEMNKHLGIYPLTGLNYSIEKESLHGHEITEKAFGLNIGAGFHYRIKNIFPFIEYKYIVGDLSQHVLSFGVLFSFKKMGITHQE